MNDDNYPYVQRERSLNQFYLVGVDDEENTTFTFYDGVTGRYVNYDLKNLKSTIQYMEEEELKKKYMSDYAIKLYTLKNALHHFENKKE